MKDLQGREYAKMSRLKVGQVVRLDAGFTCVPANAQRIVHSDRDGLYITCKHGKHHLDGQADDGENCIGVYA